MAGSVYGQCFRVTTWGESHGPALGAVIDGCPAGLELSEEDIQKYLDRRKPGKSLYSTPRKESDRAKILSGVFGGKTTGTPISILIENENQRSRDYSAIMDVFRPGHADFGFSSKYGIRDYRGGGRSSGRETAARVAAGAVAAKVLQPLGITVKAWTEAIGPVTCAENRFDEEHLKESALCMPDPEADEAAQKYLQECMKNKDSSGGIVRCRIEGVPAGVGEPVFDKLDAELGKALFSIGAVKGVEIGDGFRAAAATGSENNDQWSEDGTLATNHSGGILGGISTGKTIELRAAFKPTPSIAREQMALTEDGSVKRIEIQGRHDPVIVPRAVVVAECMAAVVVLDLMLRNAGARLENLQALYRR